MTNRKRAEDRSGTDDLRLDVEKLREEINELKKEKEEEGKGVFGLIKRWSGVLAFIAAIFAVPHGVIELYKSYKELQRHPDIQIYPVPTAEWSYKSEPKVLELRFPLTLVNKGEAGDVLTTIMGRLETASPNPQTVAAFDYTDFKCSESKEPQQISIPLRIESKSSKSMNCRIGVQLSDTGNNVFRGTVLASNTLRFMMKITGEDKRAYDMKFCFIPDDTMEGIVADPQCFVGLGE